AAGSEVIVERAEGHVPELLAHSVVAEQTAGAKEADDALAVGGRRRLGQTAGALMHGLQLFVCGLHLPEDPAGLAVDGGGQQRLAARGGEVDAVAVDDWWRVPRRQGGFPDQVLVRSDVRGQLVLIARQPRGVGTVKLRPGIAAAR